MATIQCKNCGKRISEKAEACPHCEESTLHSPTQKPSKIKQKKEPIKSSLLVTCNACGKEVSKNAETCLHCGEPIPKKKKTSLWTWFALLLFIGFIAGGVGNKKTAEERTAKTEPKKEKRDTLKGGYFACTSEALFDEIITASVSKNNLAISHLLSKGCVLTKKGVNVLVIDLGFGTSKIRAFIDNDSIILYTNTENIYY